MTPSDEQVRNAVAQQAGTWFIANQSGSLDHAERAAFMAWLKASPMHVEEYLGVAIIAHDLPAAADDPEVTLESLLESARADDTEGVVQLATALPVSRPAQERMRPSPRWRFAASMAGVMLLLAASALWWMRDGEFLGLPRAYQAAHGKQIEARLPDGSVVRLNTDSAVTVRYTRYERVVELVRGQALFAVRHDDRRRFRVAAGDVQLIAVGTRFEGYRQAEATIVTVVEGSVAVVTGSTPPGLSGFPLDALHLDAGYQVRVDARGGLAQPKPVDVQQAVAWLQQKIAFEQRPLGEVADEFNRYGSTRIEVEDATLRALPISGVFDAHDIDSFVAFLQTLDGVRVERSNTRIRVFSVKP